MSKTPATTPGNKSAAAATANKTANANASASASAPGSSAASTASSAAAVSAKSAANGSSSSQQNQQQSNSSNLSSQNSSPANPPAVNWAKIAAGANNNANARSGVNSAATSATAAGAGSKPASNAGSKPGSAAGGSGANTPNTGATPGHSKKPSATAEPFTAGKPIPMKQAAVPGVAFGSVQDSNAVLSSSPAQPPSSSSANGNPTSFGTLPAASATATGKSAGEPSTSKPAPVLSKIDFNQFFQGNSDSKTSPTDSPSQDAVASGGQASTAQPPSMLAASTSTQGPGMGSRRASTYDNAPQGALSPRAMAAQLPLQGTPVGSMAHHAASARPFSPNTSRGQPQGSYGFMAPNSPAFVPSAGGMQGQAYSSQYPGKPNGMPQQQARGGPNQQQGQSPYMQNRTVGAAAHLQQQSRSMTPGSPRTTAAGPPGQMPQGYYPNSPYAAQQWAYQQQGYPGYGYPGYGQPSYGYPPQGQQGRPPMPQQHPSQMSNPASPSPSLRPTLSASGSGIFTPNASTNAPPSEASVQPSTAPTTAPSPAPSTSSTPAPAFRHTSTPSHGNMPSPAAAVFTPAHQQHGSFSGQAPPSGTLNPTASSFGFAPRFGTATPASPSASTGPVIGPRVNKAIAIKRPPPKDADKEKLDKQKADKEKSDNEKAAAEKAEKERLSKEQSDKDASEKKAADDKAASESAEKAKKEKEAAEKAELDQKLREQEEEAKRVREQKEADEKAAKEKEEAESKKKAEEEAAIASAKAEEEKQRLAKEVDAAKEKEAQTPSAPMSRQASSVATEDATAPATPTEAAPITGKKAAPEPLDLSKNAPVSEESIIAPGSALSHARIIEDLTKVTYPESIKSPNPVLNKSAKPGKFRYDRDFLLQFMSVCKEKPEQLPSLEAIGMTDEGPPVSGGGIPIPRSASHGGSRRGGPGSVPSTPLGARGPPNLGRTVSSGFAGMGNFSGAGSAMTSEQRFAQATAAAQAGFPMPGRPGSMQRAPSTSGGIPMGGPSGRGMDRRSGRGQRRGPPERAPQTSMLPSDVAPLELSENRWTPSAQLSRNAKDQPEDAPEVVERKVKALLNKLTIENFESISKQILAWGDKSAQETDGRILKQVIALIFEKATDEQTWSAVYAKLCLFLNSFLSAEVKDQGLQEQDGSPVAGGRLFRRYLLTRCQQDYERGWAQKESATAAAKMKEADDKSKRDALEKEAEAAGVDKEVALKGADFSEEYYAAEKAKRRGLGLVRFIGELYKLNMLGRRIMMECIKKLMDNVTNPEEEDIESLCRLLYTVGAQLEKSKDEKEKDYMSIYFLRLQMIVDNKAVSSRLNFMILDLIDTRKNGWQGKQIATGPKSIAEIHQDAERQKQEEARRTASQGRGLPPRGLGRPGSQRGPGRETGPDGWTQTVAPPRPAKAGDLATLGKIRSSSSSPAFGLLGRQTKTAAKEEALTPSAAKNPFELLASQESGSAELSPPPAESSGRPKLNLKPRTVSTPAGGEAKADEEAEEGEVDEEPQEEVDEQDAEADDDELGEMDEKTKRSIQNSVAEYLGVKMIDEGKATFSALPKRHRGELVKAFVNKAVDGKKDVVETILDLLNAVADDNLVPQEAMRDAFVQTVADLEDTATDAPKAFDNVGALMDACNLSEEDVEHLQTQMVSNEDDLEGIQKRLMDAYKAASS